MILLLPLLVCSLPACLSGGRPGAVGGDSTAPTNSHGGGDAGSEGDAQPSTCETTEVEVLTSATREGVDPWHLAISHPGTVDLGGSRWGAGEDPGIRRLDVATGSLTSVGEPGRRELLIDGRDGAVLLTRSVSPTLAPSDARELVYRDDEGEVVLGGPQVDERFWSERPYLFEAPRRVGRRRAAWRGRARPARSPFDRPALYGWLGGEVTVLWVQRQGSVRRSSPPEVDEQGILWAEPWGEGSSGTLVQSWTGEGLATLREWDAPIMRVVRIGAALLWIAEDGVWRAADPASEVELLTPGACTSLQSNGRSAAYLCEAGRLGPLPAAPIPARRATLYLYRAGSAQPVQTGGDELIAAPRLSDRLLAWFSYPGATNGCNDWGPGELRVAPLDRPSARVVVAEVGLGCYCCESIWPELQLALSDRVVAWNYAAPKPDRLVVVGERAILGWARLAPHETCE